MAELVGAIVGLITVGANMSDSLHTLIDTFKDAPNEILALSDEVNDFRMMLSSLLEVNDLNEITSKEHDTVKICLNRTVVNGQHIIQKIEALIVKVRRERLEKDGEAQVNKFQWIRMVKKAGKLQGLLRVEKATMCNFIALRMLKCSARHGLHVMRLEMKMDMAIKNQLSLMEKQNDITKESSTTKEKFSQCDEQTCRRKRSPETEVKYFLPSWFGYAVANCKVDFAVRFLPLNVRIRTLNTIPYDSPILVCTQEGNLEGIVRLLQSEEASLYDVDPYGLGLLYYASYYCWRSSGKEVAVRTGQFLLDIGADADMEDERGSTPLDTLIGDTLVSLAMEHRGTRIPESSDFEHITQLFGKSTLELVADFVKTSNFATIHRVLLGIQGDCETLDDYLGKHESTLPLTDAIDVPDSAGRSALAWAVEYGWVDATRTLLKYGANPHQLVRSPGIISPLLHLAIAVPVSESADNGSLEVVRELLKAGSNVNAVDHEYWTPLHVAASWNNYDVIRELVTFGGDTLDWDLVTNDNQSAMDLSLNGGFNEKVQDILKNRKLVWEYIVSAEARTEGEGQGHESDEGVNSEGEQFFDFEEA